MQPPACLCIWVCYCTDSASILYAHFYILIRSPAGYRSRNVEAGCRQGLKTEARSRHKGLARWVPLNTDQLLWKSHRSTKNSVRNFCNLSFACMCLYVCVWGRARERERETVTNDERGRQLNLNFCKTI